MDPETDTLEMGEIFGKYELLERIATGGMAEIFRAASMSVGGFRKIVALKRILPHLSTDAEFVSLFISEAKLAVTLSHSNIVQIIDFGRIDDRYYIAMELVDGRDMTQVLIKQAGRRRTVPIEIACYILAETLRGLEFAHTRSDSLGRALSIVHRDVSPHNILVSFDGEVRLTDFGIAKARTRMSLSRPGAMLGKYAYMSPEQANAQNVDARSDVYSAAVTLYEAITGRRLFFSEDPARTLAKVRHPNVKPPSQFNKEVSHDLDDILMTALAPDPASRFSSAREFATALEGHVQDLAVGLNDSHLARFMKGLFEDEVGPARFAMAATQPAPRSSRIPVPSAITLPEAPALEDPLLIGLQEKLAADPNLWTLVQVGERLLDLDREQDAVRTLFVASTKFAQNGLLVQAVALAVQIREIRQWDDTLGLHIQRLPGLAGVSNSDAQAALDASTDGRAFGSDPRGRDALGQLLQEVFFAAEPGGMAAAMGSPVFSYLGHEELSNLAKLLRLRRIPAGTVIVEEGEPGVALYLIARGRVIIYCRNFNDEKVYLSSLSDGDCMGEFSFFTGQPRAATVEAVEDVLLFEIEQKDFDTILADFPNLTNALLQFYKERVVATLLAKSEAFGVLPPKVRQNLASRLAVEGYMRGNMIITEGEESDAFFVIKSGEVEVFTERGGDFVFLRKLRAGDFFGEIGTIQGRPRTASVRALGPCEILRMGADELRNLARTHPQMMSVLERRIAQRQAETLRTLTAGGQLI